MSYLSVIFFEIFTRADAQQLQGACLLKLQAVHSIWETDCLRMHLSISLALHPDIISCPAWLEILTQDRLHIFTGPDGTLHFFGSLQEIAINLAKNPSLLSSLKSLLGQELVKKESIKVQASSMQWYSLPYKRHTRWFFLVHMQLIRQLAWQHFTDSWQE